MWIEAKIAGTIKTLHRAIKSFTIEFGAVVDHLRATFQRNDHILFWLATVGLMALAHFYWSYHDTYFWDPKTYMYVLDTWGDWHWLKMLMKFEYSLSLMVFGILCWNARRKDLWIYGVSILLVHWGTFEFFMNFAMRSWPYAKNLFEEWFRLHWIVALFISMLGALLPFIFVRRNAH